MQEVFYINRRTKYVYTVMTDKKYRRCDYFYTYWQK